MGRFSTLAAAKAPANVLTANAEGADAYAQKPRLELASLALTSVVVDSAYRTGEQEMSRVVELLDALAKKDDLAFAAKVALYARHTHGLRTISHVIAAEIAVREGEFPWRRSFFDKIVRRPDDAVEILALTKARMPGNRIPNALKRGLAAAMLRFDEYALSKYAGGKGMKLVDVVNLVHPKAPKKHPIHALMRGTIKPAFTWEHELSEAGSEKDPEKAKARVWAKLLKEKQLGYMACLMNLRNIIQQAPKSVDAVIELLTDREQVKKSLVLPTQFLSAAKAISELNGPEAKAVNAAINAACELAMDNVPKLPGRTLVALDASNSMNEAGTFKFTPFEIGVLFSAVLYKANPDTDFMYFADDGKYMTFDQDQKLLNLHREIVGARIVGGTNFHAIFRTANRAYDRIFILSDMQGWMDDACRSMLAYGENAVNIGTRQMQNSGTTLPHKAHKEYCKRLSCDPRIYSFDLKSGGTSQFPSSKVAAMAGWTDKVFDVLANLEKDRDALIKEIDAVAL